MKKKYNPNYFIYKRTHLLKNKIASLEKQIQAKKELIKLFKEEMRDNYKRYKKKHKKEYRKKQIKKIRKEHLKHWQVAEPITKK